MAEGGADPGWRPLVAVAGATAAGWLGTSALPLVLGSLVDGLGLDEARAGALSTAELGAVTVASLALAARMGRVSRRRLALLGACLATLGNALSALAPAAGPLFAARALAGLGEGALLAAASAAAAGMRQPERVFAAATALGGTAGAVVLAGLPYAIGPWGHAGAFAALAVLSLASLPAAAGLPEGAPSPASGRASRAPHRAAGLAALAGIVLVNAVAIAVWSLSERIGLRVGLGRGEVGLVLAASTLVGLASAGLAAWLGLRRGRTGPLLLGGIVGVGAMLAIVNTSAPGLYAAAEVASGAGFFFAVPYFMGVVAALDPRGRWTAAASGGGSAGTALGPLLGGALVSGASYGALNALIVACAVGTPLLLAPALVVAARRPVALERADQVSPLSLR